MCDNQTSSHSVSICVSVVCFQNGEKVQSPAEVQCPAGWQWQENWTSDVNRAVDEKGVTSTSSHLRLKSRLFLNVCDLCGFRLGIWSHGPT